MDRRTFLGMLLAGALRPGTANADSRPNIVLVVMDDMRGSDWRALPKTRQALGGTMYDNFILTNPVCGPSRASLLSGLYSHHHGIVGVRNAGPLMLSTGIADRTLNVALHDAGYSTGLVGKYNNDFNTTDQPPDWDRWVSLWQGYPFYTEFTLTEDGRKRTYVTPPEPTFKGKPKNNKQRERRRKIVKRYQKRAKKRYLTNVLRKQAANFIRSAPTDRPYFLYFAPFAPHTPAIPAPNEKRYRKATRQRSPAFQEQDVSDKPSYVREAKRPTDDRYDELERNRLRSLASVDEAIATLAAAVRKRGDWDNTYWFVVSDNGYSMGDHGWKGKSAPYDGIVRVPALIAGPGLSEGSRNQLVANIDLAPTICALAGISLPEPVDGENLFETTREAVLVEGHHPRLAYEGVRTVDHLYVEYQTGERELYDYRSDPHELHNELADWLGHTPTADPEVVERLQQRLNELRG